MTTQIVLPWPLRSVSWQSVNRMNSRNGCCFAVVGAGVAAGGLFRGWSSRRERPP